jgi:hypothetical protein
MAKGLFLISTNYFFELKSKLLIGKGPGVDITLEGELAPQQVQIVLFENEALIKNLDTRLPVSVDRKILPEKFFLPLLNLSLIEVGDIQFIYSEEGAPRTFQIKKVLQSFDLIEPSKYDEGLMEKANQIQVKIDTLTQRIKPVIAEMEKIKNEIASLIKERDQKAHEYHLQINERKLKFDQIKVENSKSIDELNANKLEIKNVLKQAAATKVSSKLELDK